MAPIPEFQRDRYASSLVGTPGEDRSGQILAQGITKAAGQIENVAFDAAVKRQKAMDESLAVRKTTELRIAADSLAAQADVDYAEFNGSPDDRASQMRQRYEELFQKTIADVDSPGARRLLESEGMNLVGTYTINEAKKGRANQAVLAAKNTLDTVNLLAVDAANVARNTAISPTQQFMAIQGLLQQGEAAYTAGFEAYSVEDRQKLVKQIPESISKAFLSNLLVMNPEDVQGFIDSGKFDQVLSPEERAKYKDDAVAAIPKMKERRAAEQLYSDINSRTDIWKAVNEGRPEAIQMIEQSNLKSAKQLKDIALKGQDAVTDDLGTLAQLSTRIDALYDFDKKTGKKKNMKHSLELGDLDAVLDFAFDAQAQGKLKASTVKSYVDNLFLPYANELRQGMGGSTEMTVGEALTPIVGQWKTVKNMVNFFTKKNGLGPESEARIYDAVVQRFTPENRRDIPALVRDAVNDESLRQVPGLGLIPDTPARAKTSDRRMLTLQEGRGTAKAQISIPAKGTQVVNQRSKDGKTLYRVTYVDGKPTRKEVVESA